MGDSNGAIEVVTGKAISRVNRLNFSFDLSLIKKVLRNRS